MLVDGVAHRTIWRNADGWAVQIIDQTRLPHEFVTVRLDSAAAMANGFGNRGLDTSTKASLFERVTGTGRAVKKRKEEPVIEETVKTEPIVMETPTEEPKKDDEIAGLNPEDQTPGQRDEDDLLEIPAFLRRQAN